MYVIRYLIHKQAKPSKKIAQRHNYIYMRGHKTEFEKFIFYLKLKNVEKATEANERKNTKVSF